MARNHNRVEVIPSGFFLLYYALFGARILLGLQFTVVASFLAYGGFTLLLAEPSDMGCSMRLV